jgi:hypothetical protein
MHLLVLATKGSFSNDIPVARSKPSDQILIFECHSPLKGALAGSRYQGKKQSEPESKEVLKESWGYFRSADISLKEFPLTNLG